VFGSGPRLLGWQGWGGREALEAWGRHQKAPQYFRTGMLGVCLPNVMSAHINKQGLSRTSRRDKGEKSFLPQEQPRWLLTPILQV
jgi:hypothetical protein